jgi:hypothetical protein
MNWLKQLLHRLLGTQAPGDEGPGQGSRVSTNRMPLKTLDNDTLFTETGLVVEPHLKEMASGRWGESFRYEAQQYAGYIPQLSILAMVSGFRPFSLPHPLSASATISGAGLLFTITAIGANRPEISSPVNILTGT